ncbi:UNKNOWN [Stylonychia lemnae]|uniref:Uncharacterized protein n=1 Tax=Stylonychia lemnae TaxID=5949 RepID=A0A078ANA3_STYLE|nr:UNKNOWN [Stylonychia lemnae]|eukprot:CDW83376.1 UNKNOWN [Stylonychia lemnae]
MDNNNSDTNKKQQHHLLENSENIFSQGNLLETLTAQGEFLVIDSLIDIEKNRQKDIRENFRKQRRMSQVKQKLAAANQIFDPSEPFKIRLKKEKERKEQRQLFQLKVERLKEVLNMKERIYSDPIEAQRLFQDAYEQIYGFSNSKLLSELQKIEEYFHASPETFDPMTALDKLDDYVKRKNRIEKIQNEEKKIQAMSKEKSGIKKIIKDYNINILKEQNLSNHERVMIRCQEDYKTFQKYKQGNFFEKLLKGDIKEAQRKNQIKKIGEDLQKEMERQRVQNLIRKSSQKANSFWDNIKLRQMLNRVGSDEENLSIKDTSPTANFSQKRHSSQGIYGNPFSSLRRDSLTSQLPHDHPIEETVEEQQKTFETSHSNQNLINKDIIIDLNPKSAHHFKMDQKIKEVHNYDLTKPHEMSKIQFKMVRPKLNLSTLITPRETELAVLKNLSMNSYREVNSNNSRKNTKKKMSIFERERQSMKQGKVTQSLDLKHSIKQTRETSDEIIKDAGVQLNKKINMNLVQEEMRNTNFDKTLKILREFDNTDEANNIKMLYFYKVQANDDYQGLAKEVVKEYKMGMIDPSREVGKVEKSRSAVKKLIQNLRLKGSRS